MLDQIQSKSQIRTGKPIHGKQKKNMGRNYIYPHFARQENRLYRRYKIICITNGQKTLPLYISAQELPVIPYASVAGKSPVGENRTRPGLRIRTETAEKVKVQKKIRTMRTTGKIRKKIPAINPQKEEGKGQPHSGCSPTPKISFHRKNKRTVS